MRWLACCLLLTGCLRARATVVHPTDLERTSGGSGSNTAIARTDGQARETPEQAVDEAGKDLVSLELGALLPLSDAHDSARVHIAPGVRIFGSQPGTVLWGVAVGADFLGNGRGSGFALEGSVHAGNAGGDITKVEQALDLFGGITMRARRMSSAFAVGPSVGFLAMPGGHSVVMVGLGVRVTGAPR